MAHTVVLGAGPCGLAAGLELTRGGVRPLVLEREPEVGGLARTRELGLHRVDLSIHRVQDAGLTQELAGLVGPLHRVERKTIHVHLAGRRVPYPLGLSALLRLPAHRVARAGASWVRQRLGPRSAPASYADWFVQRFGRELHGWIAAPLMAKQWGIPDTRLSTAFAAHRRLSARLAHLLPARLVPREIPESFLHAPRGAGQLVEALARAARDGGASIRTGSAPVRVIHAAGRVTRLELSCGESLEVERLISTIPLPALCRRLDPPLPGELSRLVGALRFRALVVVALALRRERVGPDHVTYFPEPRFPFSRTFEPKNAAPKMSPSGRTVIGFELPCFEGDALWSSADAALAHRMASFGPEVGFAPGEVEGSLVIRVPEAYPLYELGHEEAVARLLAHLHAALGNLYLAGRNAVFHLDNMHHAFAMGRDVGRHVAAGGSSGAWHAALGRYATMSYID